MSRCDHCGKQMYDPEEVYTYKNRTLCEDCAVMIEERDSRQSPLMGCDGPVWRILKEEEDKKF